MAHLSEGSEWAIMWVVGITVICPQWVLGWRVGGESNAWGSCYLHEISLMMEGSRYLTQSQDTGPCGCWVLSQTVVVRFLCSSALSLFFSDPHWNKGKGVYGHWLSHCLVGTLVNSHHHSSWLLLVLYWQLRPSVFHTSQENWNGLRERS